MVAPIIAAGAVCCGATLAAIDDGGDSGDESSGKNDDKEKHISDQNELDRDAELLQSALRSTSPTFQNEKKMRTTILEDSIDETSNQHSMFLSTSTLGQKHRQIINSKYSSQENFRNTSMLSRQQYSNLFDTNIDKPIVEGTDEDHFNNEDETFIDNEIFKSDFERMLNIHDNQIYGSKEEVEIDYNDEVGKYENAMLSMGRQTSGYVDGRFINGKLKDIIPPNSCFLVKFSVDGKYLAVGLDLGKGVAIYDTKMCLLLYTIPQNHSISAMEWTFVNTDNSISKTDQLLAIGTFDGTLSIYYVSSDHKIADWISLSYKKTLRTAIQCIGFYPDFDVHGKTKFFNVITGEKNGYISCTSFPYLVDGRISDDKNKVQTNTIIENKNAIFSIALYRQVDFIILASGTKDGTICIHSLDANETTVKLIKKIKRKGAIRSLRFSLDNKYLFAGGYDKTVAMIDTELWECIRFLDVDGTVNTIEYDSLYRYLAVGTRSRSLYIFDTSTFHPIKRLRTPGSISSVSWGYDYLENVIAVRGESNVISILEMNHMYIVNTNFDSRHINERSSLCWSADGRFLARIENNQVLIADSTKNFSNVGNINYNNSIRCVAFCHVQDKTDLIAVAGICGTVTICRVRQSVGSVHVEKVSSTRLEEELSCVAWSTDGSFLAVGGKGRSIHLLASSNFHSFHEPIVIPEGRVNSIDFFHEESTLSEETSETIGMAVGTTDGLVIVFSRTFEPYLRIVRSRSVRYVKYHPILPLLAIGDAKNTVTIVDLVRGKKIDEFKVDGRVNSLSFSPQGDFIAVATDSGHFTMHEFETYKVVQELIMAEENALSVSFSGNNGQYLALGSSTTGPFILSLGPLFSIELVPIEGNGDVLNLPPWVIDQTVYMSWDGPSFIQRCMITGSQDSIQQAALILKNHPDSLHTFNRSTKDGCFKTALDQKKPNILKLIMKPLVDGCLENYHNGEVSLLTTDIPSVGFKVLNELVLHHPPQFAVEMLKMMTFVKVPFTEARLCSSTDKMECGSSCFKDPWGDISSPLKRVVQSSSKNNEDKIESKEGVTRIPAVLPFPELGSLNFLSALTREMPTSVFDNDAMGLVLRVLWNSEIKLFFLIDFYLFIAFYISWIFFIDISSASTNSSYQSADPYVLGCTLLTFNTFFTLIELRQFAFEGSRFYFQSKWNLNDVLACLSVYGYTSSILITNGEGSVILAACATMSLTVKLLAYLRGFNTTGWLISVLVQNFWDARGFLIVLFVILVGFTCVFRVLIGPCPRDTMECEVDYFPNIWVSFLSTIEMTMLASYERHVFDGSYNRLLAMVFFLLAILVVFVISLNALISILGDSFSRVQENATANRRKELADLILDYLSVLPERIRNRIERNTIYFHALLEADAHGDLLTNKEDWQGGLNALKRDLADLQEKNSDFTTREIERLRNDIGNDLLSLREELATTLTELSLDMKRLSRLQRDGGITISNKNVAKAVKVVKGIGKTFDPFLSAEQKFKKLSSRNISN